MYNQTIKETFYKHVTDSLHWFDAKRFTSIAKSLMT